LLILFAAEFRQGVSFLRCIFMRQSGLMARAGGVRSTRWRPRFSPIWKLAAAEVGVGFLALTLLSALDLGARLHVQPIELVVDAGACAILLWPLLLRTLR
jgi:hypothetical protein